MKYARSVTLRGCNFDTIDTDDTGAARVDCDGFKYFSGEAFEGASEFFPTHFEATGNRFKDCAGRAIKGQCTHGVVTNNTMVRSGVLPIHGFWSDINMQMGGGTICNNDAVYSPVDGVSPFTHDGAAGANGALVSFYHAPQSGRQGRRANRDGEIPSETMCRRRSARWPLWSTSTAGLWMKIIHITSPAETTKLSAAPLM